MSYEIYGPLTTLVFRSTGRHVICLRLCRVVEEGVPDVPFLLTSNTDHKVEKCHNRFLDKKEEGDEGGGEREEVEVGRRKEEEEEGRKGRKKRKEGRKRRRKRRRRVRGRRKEERGKGRN